MSVPVIVGVGLAGLTVALSLAPHPVVVLGRRIAAGLTSSELAQGGIACALGDEDHAKLHEEDTLVAGAGLCDHNIVRLITSSGPRAIEQLASWGVTFDTTSSGRLVLGLEGAHSRRRIVHANGDSTGASVMNALIERAKKTPSIRIVEEAELQEIETDDKGVVSLCYYDGGEKKSKRIMTRNIVVSTGSACALWRHTTVPTLSWGHGFLIASRAGALLRDLEFVQFHPTALDCGLNPMPLISEALRGEGAKLLNEEQEAFVEELSPRDVVARSIWSELQDGKKVYLDARHVPNFGQRFPTILDACLRSGFHPNEQMIPIRPVAHYHMGGIATDENGATNVNGLWACGEAACTGFHGANRLASNSLLEAVVMGQRISNALKAKGDISNHCFTQEIERGYKFESSTNIARVRSLMVSHLGLRRHQRMLDEAKNILEEMEEESNHAQAALMIVRAAITRQESRGAHYREDFPEMDVRQARSLYVKRLDTKLVIGDHGEMQ
jgi:L-aspartate oxidase